MARKRIVRFEGDIREHPRYSVNEAADYLGIPSSTLHSWISTGNSKRRPLIIPADPENSLLSFYNLIEAHVLVTTRRRHIPMHRVRTAVEFMHEVIGGDHPLATHKFATSEKGVFVQKLAGATVDASRYGQAVLGNMLDKYLRGITRGRLDRMPIQVQPMKPGTLTPSPIVINPFISSGSPIIKGTGIVAEVVWNRAKGGETLKELAADYGLKLREIETVVKYLDAVA